MKKLLTLASVVTLLVAGTALAASPERLFIQPNATFPAGAPSTTNNDDSCDVGNAPAATLLLPFFSVDVGAAATNETTLFTLLNTSDEPQIAHITIWTDWSFPVIDFNIFLTGYDIQGINLRDIIVNGDIPPTGMDSNGSGTITSADWGEFSEDNRTGNANFDSTAVTNCTSLPGPIPESLRAAIQSALTTGLGYLGCTEAVGGTNTTAQGYVTIDVADTCSQLLPTDPLFFESDILWDNTLTGDYQHVSVSGAFSGGESLVSIRAIPEGGGVAGDRSATTTVTNFPFTFYDRYTPAANREMDRRMPLPGIFAARFIDAEAGDVTGFESSIQIWREGNTVGGVPGATTAACDGSGDWFNNAELDVETIVRFDEHENPSVSVEVCQISPCPQIVGFVTEESSRNRADDAGSFPASGTGAEELSGWLYLNLNRGCVNPESAVFANTYCTDRLVNESQAWVTTHMAAEGSRFAVDFDATWLQNGCTANPGPASIAGETGDPGIIGPGPNATPSTP